MKPKTMLVIVSLLLALLLTSCADSTAKIITPDSSPLPVESTLPPPTESTSPQPTESASPQPAESEAPPTETDEFPDSVIIRNEPGELQFDWDEAMKNIYIAGQKITFPETLADLGDEFSLKGEHPIEYGDGEIGDVLIYDERKVAGISLKGTTDDYGMDSDVTYIGVYHGHELCSLSGIYSFRIGQKTNINDIIAFFGTPSHRGETTIIISKSIGYTLDEEHGIYFRLDAEDIITWITITNYTNKGDI